jgi:hypothetical protein
MDSDKMRSSSTHKFIVPTNSVFRLFLDTSLSGSLVKYRLVDGEQNELVSSLNRDDLKHSDGFLK